VVANLIFASGFYRECYIHEKVVDDNRIHLRRCCLRERRTEGGEGDGMHHRVLRVVTAAFWRTFNHEGKISPGW